MYFTDRRYIRPTANTNPGIDADRLAIRVIMVSCHLPRFTAVITPNKIPNGNEIQVETKDRYSVTPIFCPIISVTGR